MAVPNIFATATTAIPLSQLDQNFATAITLGNTAVYLGNTTTSLGNVTLATATLTNVTISTVATAITAAQGGTGLTSPGTSGNVLTSNGTVWLSQAAAGGVSSAIPTANVQTSGTSATFTIPTGITKMRITVVAGGGTSPQSGVSGGGGGGGTAIKTLTGLTPGNTLTYTVGGSAASSQVASGTQSITTISATGGSAGGANGEGGAGGIGSNGDLNIRGGAGSTCDPTDSLGGSGGSSYLGGGAAPRVNGGAYGGGGGSGSSGSGPTTGGAGVIIFEY